MRKITIVPTADVKSDQDEADRVFGKVQALIKDGLDILCCNRFKDGYQLLVL